MGVKNNQDDQDVTAPIDEAVGATRPSSDASGDDDEFDEDGFQVATGFVEAEHPDPNNNPGTEWTVRFDAEAKEAHVELDIGIEVLELSFEGVETFADARAKAEAAAIEQQAQADEMSESAVDEEEEDEDNEDDDEDADAEDDDEEEDDEEEDDEEEDDEEKKD
jgi:hypothetical protein